jgi:hypothetical protein
MKGQRPYILAILLLSVIVIVLLLALFLPRQPSTGQPGQTATSQPGQTATSQPPAGTRPYPANIDYEGINSYGNYTTAALNNPNIGAVDISMNWSQVEPQQGQFNWAPADKVMADWSAHGKMFTLIIRYVKELENPVSCNSPQQLLPQWETQRIKTICDSSSGLLIPDYFDPTFKSDLKAYVQAIANHIAQSPYKKNLLYVRAAVGIGGEGFPFFRRPGAQTVLSQLEGYGYSPAAWAAWQKELMLAYKQAFSYTTVIYPVNAIGIDSSTGQPVQTENSEWAAAQGMGIGQQGLKPTTNYSFFQQLREQHPKMYIQFQTGYSNGNADVPGDVQSAEKNGAQFVEWFTADILKPSNQSAFAQLQQYVNNKYGYLPAQASTSVAPTRVSMPSLAFTSIPLTLPTAFFLRATSLQKFRYGDTKSHDYLRLKIRENPPTQKSAMFAGLHLRQGSIIQSLMYPLLIVKREISS